MPRELKCQGNEDISGFGDSIKRLKLSGCGCLTISAGGEPLAVVPLSPEGGKRGGFGWLIGSQGD
jgi:hypothetical protein